MNSMFSLTVFASEILTIVLKDWDTEWVYHMGQFGTTGKYICTNSIQQYWLAMSAASSALKQKKGINKFGCEDLV